MKFENILQIIMIVLALMAIYERNYFRIILYFSAFSFVAASLYYLYKAPDVALAEAAIGSAIIPLVFIIAISKQNQFIVLNDTGDDFLDNLEDFQGRGYKLLEEFCRFYRLKLTIHAGEQGQVTGVFRMRNIDLIVERSPKTGKYLLKGKKASVLLNKLEQMVQREEDMEVVRIGDEETYD